MLPILQVGPLAIQLSGLLVLLGIWLGLSLSERYAVRYGLQPSLLEGLVFVGLIAGLIGSRLSYVVRYPDVFTTNPTSLVSINPGLLDPGGGLATGLVASLIYIQRKNLTLWATLDALTPLLAVVSIALSFSHIASGVPFGMPTDLPWGIELWGAKRHPIQLYEVLASAMILVILWPSREFLRDRQPGWYILAFTTLSAIAYLFIEGFRGDSRLLVGGLRSGQVWAWIVIAISLWGLYKLSNSRPPGEESIP